MQNLSTVEKLLMINKLNQTRHGKLNWKKDLFDKNHARSIDEWSQLILLPDLSPPSVSYYNFFQKKKRDLFAFRRNSIEINLNELTLMKEMNERKEIWTNIILHQVSLSYCNRSSKEQTSFSCFANVREHWRRIDGLIERRSRINSNDLASSGNKVR